MRRRDFIMVLGGVATWPLAARAQQQGVALVGLLSGTQLDDQRFEAVRQGLKEVGYIEGRNVAIKYRSADGRFDRLPALAAALVADSVAVILTFGPPAAVAAKAATATIPIVFATGADPVELGLVVNPANPTSESQTRDAQTAALALGLRLPIQSASSEAAIDAAFASFAQQRVNAVMVGTDAFFGTRHDQLVGLTARHAMPAIYYLREAVAAGGLMSYGTSATDGLRLAAAYAGRILKGERPGDLPVQQTVKFELGINLKTAKALSLTVPDKLLAAADEVIE